MKRILCVFLVFCITVSAAGCCMKPLKKTNPDSSEPTAPDTVASTAPVQTLPTQTLPVTTQPEPETEPAATIPKPFERYLVKVPRGDFPIRKGPGYDYPFVGTVEVAGIYTIVAEERDSNGDLWGKLKSGIGWINLSELEGTSSSKTTLSLEEVTRDYMYNTSCNYCQVDSSKYSVYLLLQVSAPVTDVTFYSLDLAYDYLQTERFYEDDLWHPDAPLVVQVAFPGDMSAYGISFTDSDGAVHYYCITESLSGIGPRFSANRYYP